MKKRIPIILALSFLLGLSVSLARAHPGVGGCKAVDQGGVKYDTACQATVQTFTSWVGSYREKTLAANWATGLCFAPGWNIGNSAPATLAACIPGGGYFVGSVAPLNFDQAMLIKSFTCGWFRPTTWDSGDTTTICAAECNTTTCNCLSGNTLTITSASATSGVDTVTVGATTSMSSDFFTTIRITASTDAGTAGAQINMSCMITYEYP